MWEYQAKLHRVIDGDTVELTLDLGFNVTITEGIRVAGVDTPEIRGGTAETKRAGRIAREYTKGFCAGSEGWPLIVATEWDRSFERYVGSVSRDGVDLAEALISHGFGVPSDG